MLGNLRIPLIFRIVEKNSLIIIFVFFFASLLLLKPRIGGDGFSYYAWLRSPVFDHDLDFTNEYNEFNPEGYWTAKDEITPAGKPANPFSIGPAILWAPWFGLAYMLTKVAGPALEAANNGYSFFYQLLIPLGSLTYALFGTLILNKFLQKFFDKKTALWTILSILFGTMLLNYLFNEPASSHPLSFFIITLFYWFWIKSNFFSSTADSYFAGALAGLMCLIRWQHAIFILPIFWSLVIKEKRPFDFIFFCVPLAIVCSLQFIAWRFVYGSFFVIPQGTGFFISPTEIGTWLQRIPLLLFSPNHGLFYWTPCLVLAFIGLFLFLRYKPLIAKSFTAVIILSIMVNSWVWEFYGGWSFGARRLIEILPLLAFGVAMFWSTSTTKKYVKPVSLFFIAWNILLWFQFIGKSISPTGTLIWPDWVWGQISAVKYAYLAFGHSSSLSYVYRGFTENALYFAHGITSVVIIVVLFLSIVSLISISERKENYI